VSTAACVSTTTTACMSAAAAASMSTTTGGCMSAAAASMSTAAGYCMACCAGTRSATGMTRYRCMSAAAAGANCRPAAACFTTTPASCSATAASCPATAAAGKVAVICGITAAAVIPSATTVFKAMATPAVAIAPAGPGAHAQENAVVEVAWTIKAVGRTGVRGVVVVAVLANGLNADANPDDDLCLRRWRHGQAGEQCCGSDECLESTHM